MIRNKRDRRNDLPEGDDGHTIANMNVEGMPWYRPVREDVLPQGEASGEQLTRRQMRMYTASALKAAMLVVLIMCLGIVLFVAFCVYVWFR